MKNFAILTVLMCVFVVVGCSMKNTKDSSWKESVVIEKVAELPYGFENHDNKYISTMTCCSGIGLEETRVIDLVNFNKIIRKDLGCKAIVVDGELKIEIVDRKLYLGRAIWTYVWKNG